LALEELRQLMSVLDVRLVIDGDALTASYVPLGLIDPLGAPSQAQRFPFTVSGTVMRRGNEARMVIVTGAGNRRRPNARLVSLLVRSFAARRALVEEALPTDRSAANARKSYLSRIARISYLAPDIVEAIFQGTQPASLGARQMLRTGELPLSWSQQRQLFEFDDPGSP
jgi:hypothetical protein